jgi:lambda family phage tail tape measure protein
MSGSEIKNVLTLDVSKFISALDKAVGNLESLDKRLKSAGEVTGGFEKNIASVAKGMESAVSKFAMLDQTLQSFANRLDMTAGRFESITASSGNATKGIDNLNSAMKRSASATSDDWLRRYATDIAGLSPALNKAVASILEFDRANIISAESSEKMADRSVAAKLKTLNAERESNGKIIASRATMITELDSLQKRLDSRSNSSSNQASAFFGKNVAKGDSMRAEAADYAQAATNARNEMVAVQALVSELEWKNAEIDKSIKLIHTEAAAQKALTAAELASAEAAKLSKQAENEAANASKQASQAAIIASNEAAQARINNAKDVARIEREQAEQITKMWKGMAQLWAASKIEHGIGSSVEKAGDMQREQLNLSGLNLPQDKIDKITKQAWDDSHVLKFASALDMVRAKLALIGGLPNAPESTLNDIMPTIAKAANNIRTMTGDKSPKGFEDMVRNIAGVIESRGQTTDPEAAKRTADLVQKIYIGTGKKIDIADVETFLRRFGTGADKISDEGLAKIVAFMDASKVSGGHGGAGGAGISTVGTAFKMFQKMANGGMMTERATKEFIDAGLMDTSAANGKKGKEAIKELRSGGLTVSAMSNADPVAGVEAISKAALGYMTKPENLKKYFPGGNAGDPAAIKDAMMKFVTKLGWSTTAAQVLTIGVNPDIMNRATAQEKQITGSKGADEFDKTVMNSYAGNVQKFKASIENLKTSIGTNILPLVTKLVSGIASLADMMGRFANNNPMAAELLTIAAAGGGVVLAFKGMMSMFGIFGSVTSGLRLLTGASKEAEVAAASSSRSFLSLGGTVTGLKGDWTAYAKTVRTNVVAASIAAEAGTLTIGNKFTLLGSTVGRTAKLIGKGFARMIPFVGELLLAWDFAELLSHVKVGGHEIGEWMGKWMDDIFTYAQKKWNSFVGLFSSGGAALADAANRKLSDEKTRADTANGFGNKTPEKIAAAQKDRSPERLMLDKVDSPNIDPISGQPWAKAVVAHAPAPANAASTVKDKLVHPTAAQIAEADKAFDPAPKRKPKVFEDLVAKTFEELTATVKKEQLKIASLNSGESSYQEQARAKVVGQWAGGQLDKAHDPRNREFVNRAGGFSFDANTGKYRDAKGAVTDAANAIDWNAKGKSGKSAQDLVDLTAKTLQLADAEKELAFSKERSKSITAAADEASLRYANNGLQKETKAMLALRREYERLEALNPQAGLDAKNNNSKYAQDKASALLGQARSDASGYAFDTHRKTQDMTSKFLTNADGSVVQDADRIEAEHTRVMQKAEESYRAMMSTLDALLAKTKAAGGTETADYKKALADKNTAYKEYNAQKEAQNKQFAESMMTPVEKLAIEWQKVGTQIDSITANWANTFLNNMHTMITGGKVSWRGFLASMLSDLSKVALRQAMGGLITSSFSGLGGILQKALASMSGTGAPTGGKAYGQAVASTAAQGAANPGALNAVFAAVSAAGSKLKAAFSVLTTDGIGPAIASMFRDTATTTVKIATTTTADSIQTQMSAKLIFGTIALDAFTTAVINATAAQAGKAIAGVVTAVAADGGVFSGPGISAYSGSVVSSPTIFPFASGTGLMGEAGPEAILPLKRDSQGRLGITASGGSQGGSSASGQTVNISVVVNSDGSNGGSSSSKSSGGGTDATAAWNQVAGKIKGIVIEQLVTQSRPGGILYK